MRVSSRIVVAALVALCVCVSSAASLDPVHQSMREQLVGTFLGGVEDGSRIVASPVPIEGGATFELLWSGGELIPPEGTVWIAVIDDRMPGALGFHPVRHVFLDGDLEVLEVRDANYYPRFYRNGERLGWKTLVKYSAKPGELDGKRELIEQGKGGRASRDFSYNEFYAVIIEGDVPSGSSYSEFWSDNVWMFRLLLEFGYDEDHIHVLYGDGADEADFECEYYRENMTDFPAHQQYVRDLFTWMRDGNASQGIDRVTDQDFLFLFTFDHGGSSGGCDATLCLMDGCMPDTEFASYFNQIAYKHRAVDMQQCHSGGFIDNLENDTTVISTAANCTESAYEADEWDDCGGGVTVNYGEWNYWWMSAMQGHLPWPGFEPVDADTNDDGKVSFLEAHNYALANDDRTEHPQWSDPGNLGDDLSLQTTWDGAHLVHDSHTIEDPSGNDDGVVNPGETVTMPVTLFNNGTLPATGATGTLATSSTYVTIEDNQASYPEIAAGGGIGTSLPDHYRWTASADAPDHTEVAFTLDWQSDGGAYGGTTAFVDYIDRVELAVHQTSVFDGAEGNGIADPGETIDLAVTLRNRGHAEARSVSGTLTTSSPYASITRDMAQWPAVPGLGVRRSLEPHFGLAIAADTPDKTWIDCTLALDAADGYQASLPLRFMVGSRGTVLLVADGDQEDADLLELIVGDLGFGVETQSAAETDPASWAGYTLLVWSAGGNPDPIDDESHRNALESHVADGQRLLLVGGDLAHHHRYDSGFSQNVLHVANWRSHDGGDLAVGDVDHPLTTVPQVLDETLAHGSTDASLADAAEPTANASSALVWSQQRGRGSLIAFDDDALEGNGGQVLTLLSAVRAIDEASGAREQVLGNALSWLLGNDDPYLVLTGESFRDSAEGNGDGVLDPGETVEIEIRVGNRGSGTATGVWARAWLEDPAQGRLLDNFVAWPTINSGAEQPSSAPHLTLQLDEAAPCGATVPIALEIWSAEGFVAHRHFELPVGAGGGLHTTYSWGGDRTPIPNPGVLEETIVIADPFVIGDVNTRLDVAHSSTTLIRIDLISPTGKQITLHDHTDRGPRMNTTFDAQTQPDGPGAMSDLDGDEGHGTWTVRIEDDALDMMMGALDAWSLIFDTENLCHGLTCSAGPAGDIGNTLRVEALGDGDLRLSWGAASGAALYRVWRAPNVQMNDAQCVGSTSALELEERGLPQRAPLYCYSVRAENECHDPAP